MNLTFLGKETQGGGSPTLYETDRDSYVLQGWKVPGQPPGIVEIPESLLTHLRVGTIVDAPLVATGRRWRGDSGECPTFTVAGVAVTDEQVLATLDVPCHEACIEVGRRRGER
ncbi:hypothetical protein ACPCHT_05225 [Nucisporomicrobium flavum]|jgi:hypothetical protein|uniref:hypothetical protein n=1 Tax=Nucisporomicrobium flavum TaxID=2785915 RepID=UPI003C2E28F4